MSIRIQIKSLFIILLLFVFTSGQKQYTPKKCLDTSSLNKKESDNQVSDLEKNIFSELNKLRKTPKSFVKDINDLKKFLDGNVLRIPNQMAFQMIEGLGSLNSTVSDLQTTSGLSSFSLSKGLSKAAKDHLEDLLQNPELGHTGKDGSTLRERILRVGKVEKFASENINYYDDKPRQIILRMLIDDGVPSRSHRKNLLNPNFKQIGIGCGKTKKDSKTICVFVFADKFTDSKDLSKNPVSY